MAKQPGTSSSSLDCLLCSPLFQLGMTTTTRPTLAPSLRPMQQFACRPFGRMPLRIQELSMMPQRTPTPTDIRSVDHTKDDKLAVRVPHKEHARSSDSVLSLPCSNFEFGKDSLVAGRKQLYARQNRHGKPTTNTTQC